MVGGHNMFEVRWREYGRKGNWLGAVNLPRQGTVTIGRDEGADLILTDSSVSRSHAIIICDKGIVQIKDLGSSNGTYVNGRRLHNGVWELSDTLRIGPFELRLFPTVRGGKLDTGETAILPDHLRYADEPLHAGAYAGSAQNHAQAEAPPNTEPQTKNFFEQHILGFFDIFILLFRSLFYPRTVAKEIKLGDKEDFNFRLGYIFKTTALYLFFLSIVAFVTNTTVFGVQRLEFLFQLLYPIYTLFMCFLMFVVWRVFGLITLKFSEFLQAISLFVGMGLFVAPFLYFPALYASFAYFKNGEVDPFILRLIDITPKFQSLKVCTPQFGSIDCLKDLGIAFQSWTVWPPYVVLIILLGVSAITLKHSIGIKYWKQFVGFILFLIIFAFLYLVVYLALLLLLIYVTGNPAPFDL